VDKFVTITTQSIEALLICADPKDIWFVGHKNLEENYRLRNGDLLKLTRQITVFAFIISKSVPLFQRGN
jgi:hypothetical protein